MDNLTYTYEEPSARLNTNRLLHVQDAVSGSANPTDFEVTAAHNPSNPYYAYDQIGNLVKDSSEAIQKIEWDVYGKLKKVDRNSSSTKPDIEFFYNSAGQRIMKLVKPNGGTGAMSTWKYTIWAYDLGGNVMAEYGIDYVTASNKYTINAKSHFLYGAGRLGKDLRDSTDYVPLAFRPTGAYTEVQSCSSCATDAVAGAGSYLYGPTVTHTRQLGYKQFELSNHTGNILMVVSDRKNAVDIGTWVAGSTSYNTSSFDRKLDYYVADVVEVTDYYPGGMPMPGRSIVDTKFSSFKFGHNGQYNDDEIYGKGNTQMAEFWEYDARLMRRWNTDPMAHAGQSLYEAFYSNPIAFADPLGLKPEGGPGRPGRKAQVKSPNKFKGSKGHKPGRNGYGGPRHKGKSKRTNQKDKDGTESEPREPRESHPVDDVFINDKAWVESGSDAAIVFVTYEGGNENLQVVQEAKNGSDNIVYIHRAGPRDGNASYWKTVGTHDRPIPINVDQNPPIFLASTMGEPSMIMDVQPYPKEPTPRRPDVQHTPPPGRRTPSFRGQEIAAKTSRSFEIVAKFNPHKSDAIINFDEIKDDLVSLVILLKEFPDVVVTIKGNAAPVNKNVKWTDKVTTELTLGELALNRANYIRTSLIEKFGVNPNQLKTELGVIGTARTTTFTIFNP